MPAEEGAEYSAASLVDGSDATWWSAPAGPPQWVEIDLEADETGGRVQILVVNVSPPGAQTHRVFIRSANESGKGNLVGEVSADACQGDWLTITFAPIPDARFIRVKTTAMDGWVILHEIRVLAE